MKSSIVSNGNELLAVDEVGSIGAFRLKYLTVKLDVGAIGTSQPVEGTVPTIDAAGAREATLCQSNNRFATLINSLALPTEELREDDIIGGDLYRARALDGTATTVAQWEVVRFYREATGKVNRTRYRANVAWDSRQSGW